VTERNEGRRGGTFREYDLDMDESLVLDAMDDTVEDVGLHGSVQDFLIDEPEPDVVDASIDDFGSGW